MHPTPNFALFVSFLCPTNLFFLLLCGASQVETRGGYEKSVGKEGTRKYFESFGQGKKGKRREKMS